MPIAFALRGNGDIAPNFSIHVLARNWHKEARNILSSASRNTSANVAAIFRMNYGTGNIDLFWSRMTIHANRPGVADEVSELSNTVGKASSLGCK